MLCLGKKIPQTMVIAETYRQSSFIRHNKNLRFIHPAQTVTIQFDTDGERRKREWRWSVCIVFSEAFRHMNNVWNNSGYQHCHESRHLPMWSLLVIHNNSPLSVKIDCRLLTTSNPTPGMMSIKIGSLMVIQMDNEILIGVNTLLIIWSLGNVQCNKHQCHVLKP